MPGYCETDDVRQALQERELSAELNTTFVTAAIEGENEWLRRKTNRHWFDSSDTTGELFTSALSQSMELQDVPSSPHPQGNQLPRADTDTRYPRTVSGGYAKIVLDRRNVQSITQLDVRTGRRDWTDWVAASDKTEGKGDDYYLRVNPTTGVSELYVSVVGLSVDSWDDAVEVSYEWGVDGIPETIRRAVALRAGASLVMDDDAQVGIPNDGQLVSVQTKADKMQSEADRLLKSYTSTPIA